MPAVDNFYELTPEWYGSFATNPNQGIFSLGDNYRYLELQYQTALSSNVTARVFTIPIPSQIGKARRVMVHLHTTLCTFGTAGSQTRYSVARLGITTEGFYTITNLGRLSQTETGTTPVAIYDINAQIDNGVWVLRLNVLCSLDAVISGELILDGIQ